MTAAKEPMKQYDDWPASSLLYHTQQRVCQLHNRYSIIIISATLNRVQISSTGDNVLVLRSNY